MHACRYRLFWKAAGFRLGAGIVEGGDRKARCRADVGGIQVRRLTWMPPVFLASVMCLSLLLLGRPPPGCGEYGQQWVSGPCQDNKAVPGLSQTWIPQRRGQLQQLCLDVLDTAAAAEGCAANVQACCGHAERRCAPARRAASRTSGASASASRAACSRSGARAWSRARCPRSRPPWQRPLRKSWEGLRSSSRALKGTSESQVRAGVFSSYPAFASCLGQRHGRLVIG